MMIKGYLLTLSEHENAQGLVEYALILVLIALVVVAALAILGPTLGNTYSMISQRVGEL